MRNKDYLIVLDTEVIGPNFLICTHTIRSGKTRFFWNDDREQFRKLYENPNVTFVTFNGMSFDAPLVQAYVNGQSGQQLKDIANAIIEQNLMPWQTRTQFDIGDIRADFIDIKQVAPGVMLSLKTYEGRMHFKRLQDMPIDHTQQTLTERQRSTVESYCLNDVMATLALYKTIEQEVALREEMGENYGIDLRSKSGAQAAEAVLRKVCEIPRRDIAVPRSVAYKTPGFVKTANTAILALIKQIEEHEFLINPNTGSPVFPDFLKAPIQLGHGTYQFGIGGLHSQHDTQRHLVASQTLALADWDVVSYYPSLLIKAGLIPKLADGKGALFLATYTDIFNRRIEAKRSGDKMTANSLKLVLNSTFGKLGNQFCSFYSPDLMLAVTITGQLNLLCLIDAMEKLPTVRCESANTDGVLLAYHPDAANMVKAAIMANSTLTGFEYEETPYREVAQRDVNSYVAITTDGKPKRKGAFALAGVMENGNPTFQICADAAAQYLLDRTPVEDTVNACRDIRQFVAIRNVTGGGVQHLYVRKVDDWVLEEDLGTAANVWFSAQTGKRVKRKSRPAPLEVAAGGKAFGRVARWYRSTRNYQPLTYASSGNKVPDTDQAHLCLELPEAMPADVDFDWYAQRARDLLASAGVTVGEENESLSGL